MGRSKTGRRFREAAEWEEVIRSGDGLMLSFVVPVILMIIIFVQRGIFPFGEESFLRTDMYHQYAPFFSEFQYKLRTGGSLLYSWNIGMGVNFAALYSYYLASPFNWLLYLCPKAYVLEFMTYLIVFKTGLAGLSMSWYLKKHCRTDHPGIAFFGIFYAMSGYMAAYSWNIMWLDCIMLFPLIVLALEELVHEGRCLKYTVFLGLSIFSNYYISIMTCIFMVIDFIALLVLEDRMSRRKFVTRCLQFGASSLLAGALAALTLLPEIYTLQSTASGDSKFPTTFTEYFSIFDMIARHIGNVESEIGLDHWPNIYCGVAVFLLFTLYLMVKKISVKEKAVTCVLLLILLGSFAMNIPNFIWHGFHYPNSLPCRQSYIYIFLMLVICCRACQYVEDFSEKQIYGAFWGAVIFIILAQKLVTQEHFHFIVFYVAIFFLALYLAVICYYRKGPGCRVAALLAALFLVSLEAAVNMAVTSVTTTSRTAYTKDNEDVRTLTELAGEQSEEFFRMKKISSKTKNDGAWMNFPSISLFSSMASADLSSLMKKLGCESSTNAYGAEGTTPLTEALLNVRYGIYSEEPDEDGLKTVIAEQNGTWLCENTYTLPLGFVVDDGWENRWNIDLGNPADVQNSLADSVGAPQFFYLMQDVWGEGKSMTFIPAESGVYYAYVTDKKITDVSVMTANKTKNYEHVDRGYLLSLGFCPAGQEVVLSTTQTDVTMQASIYRVSQKGLSAICEELGRYPWSVTEWTDTSLKGTVDAGGGGYLFTTIPYDEGWTATVDGEEVLMSRMLDAFLAVPVGVGTHTIELHYFPRGLKAGAIITTLALLAVIALGIGEKTIQRRRERWDDDFEIIEYEDDEDEYNEDEHEEDECEEEQNSENEYVKDDEVETYSCRAESQEDDSKVVHDSATSGEDIFHVGT